MPDESSYPAIGLENLRDTTAMAVRGEMAIDICNIGGEEVLDSVGKVVV